MQVHGHELELPLCAPEAYELLWERKERNHESRTDHESWISELDKQETQMFSNAEKVLEELRPQR